MFLRSFYSPRLILTLMIMIQLIQAMSSTTKICPRSCACLLTTIGPTVNCQHQWLPSVPSPLPKDLLQLTLSYNSIVTLNASDFNALAYLRFLDVSICKLEFIASGTFSSLVSLESLDLSFNLLEFLDSDLFSALPNLRYLYLNNNQLASLSDGLFSGLHLVELRLDINDLRELLPTTFFNSTVSNLTLDYNRLRFWPTTSFTTEMVETLQMLSLSYNREPVQFQVGDIYNALNLDQLLIINDGINDTSFLRSFRAISLDLSGNRYLSIDEFRFYENLRFTKKLYLQNLQLTELKNDTFNHLISAELVDLSSNQLASLDMVVFRNSTILKTLILNSNRLTTIPSNIGQYSQSLVSLQLSSNMISHLSPESFDNTPNLKELDLSLNRIQIFKADLQPIFDRIPTLNLDSNPLHCNCETRWLRIYLNIFRSPIRADYCYSPKQIYIWDLTPVNFTCIEPEIINLTSMTTSGERNSVERVSDNTISTTNSSSDNKRMILSCSAIGDPAPVIRWTNPAGDFNSDITPPPADRAITRTNSVLNMSLCVEPGTYCCVASNLQGNTSECIDVTLSTNWTNSNNCSDVTDTPFVTAGSDSVSFTTSKTEFLDTANPSTILSLNGTIRQEDPPLVVPTLETIASNNSAPISLTSTTISLNESFISTTGTTLPLEGNSTSSPYVTNSTPPEVSSSSLPSQTIIPISRLQSSTSSYGTAVDITWSQVNSSLLSIFSYTTDNLETLQSTSTMSETNSSIDITNVAEATRSTLKTRTSTPDTTGDTFTPTKSTIIIIAVVITVAGTIVLVMSTVGVILWLMRRKRRPKEDERKAKSRPRSSLQFAATATLKVRVSHA